MPPPAGRGNAALAALVALAVVRAIVPPRVAPGCRPHSCSRPERRSALALAWRARREPADAPWRRDPGVFVLVALLLGLLAGLLGAQRARGARTGSTTTSTCARCASAATSISRTTTPPSRRSDARAPATRRSGAWATSTPSVPRFCGRPCTWLGDGLAAVLLDDQRRRGDGPFQRNAVAVAGLCCGAGWGSSRCIGPRRVAWDARPRCWRRSGSRSGRSSTGTSCRRPRWRTRPRSRRPRSCWPGGSRRPVGGRPRGARARDGRAHRPGRSRPLVERAARRSCCCGTWSARARAAAGACSPATRRSGPRASWSRSLRSSSCGGSSTARS